jgi:hypothetical protein
VKTLIGANYVGWIVGAIAAFQPKTIAEWIILAAAVVVALGTLHAKVGVPMIEFARKAGRGVDAMLESPSRFERIEKRLDHGSERMARIEARLDDRAPAA